MRKEETKENELEMYDCDKRLIMEVLLYKVYLEFSNNTIKSEKFNTEELRTLKILSSDKESLINKKLSEDYKSLTLIDVVRR